VLRTHRQRQVISTQLNSTQLKYQAQKMPKRRFSKMAQTQDASAAAQTCTICFESFTEEQSASSFQCAHTLCVSCDNRLSSVGDHRCPTCRSPRIGFSAAAAASAANSRFAAARTELDHESAMAVMQSEGWSIDAIAFSSVGTNGNRFFPGATVVLARTPQHTRRRRSRRRHAGDPGGEGLEPASEGASEEALEEEASEEGAFDTAQRVRSEMTTLINALTTELTTVGPNDFVARALRISRRRQSD